MFSPLLVIAEMTCPAMVSGVYSTVGTNGTSMTPPPTPAEVIDVALRSTEVLTGDAPETKSGSPKVITLPLLMVASVANALLISARERHGDLRVVVAGE